MYILMYFPKGVSLPIRRSDLEYPTENVSFTYLSAIDKVGVGLLNWGVLVVTRDIFVDKSVFGGCQVNNYATLSARYIDYQNYYFNSLVPRASTADHRIGKYVNGEATILASEAVDISSTIGEGLLISCSGSTIKSMRWDTRGFLDPFDLPTPTATLTVTDVDLVEGRFGFRHLNVLADHGSVAELTAYLLPPMSSIPKPLVIIEYEVVGKGTLEDPIRPNMPEDLVEVSKADVTPEEWEALQANPKGKNGLPLVNRLAVTWGAINYKGEPTMLCAIYSGSPSYLDKVENRVLKHIEYARRRGHKVFKTPRSPAEARELWREIKRDRPDMLVEPEELAYQLIGSPELEPDSVACFYERELVNLNRIKGVPEWELERTLRRWEKLAEKYGRSGAKEKLRRIRRK